MNTAFKKYLLSTTTSSNCKEVEVIQSLWSGYGKISRYKLTGANKYNTVVVKNISLQQAKEHPRGWNSEISHNRKVKSYQVETNWYENWSHQCSEHIRIPMFFGSFSEGSNQWIILEDLDKFFPVRKHQLNIAEVKVCLKWLANFHANFLNKEPTDLWKIGTYWHLETRPEEFETIQHSELKAKAHLLDEALNNCQFKTIVHGDANLANFCFSAKVTTDKLEVGVVDFQYVGGGCGMKDIAYFLGSCLTGEKLALYQNDLLDFYFEILHEVTSKTHINFRALEIEWRKMYPIACADFTRFLVGWMPGHQKLNDYQLTLLESVLKDF